MTKEKIQTNKLFKTKEALNILPETFEVCHDLHLNENAKVDIIINGYDKPELSNATALNYILLEDKIPVNIIIVESSGKPEIFEKLINHEKVSKILIEDRKITHPVYGTGSYGMSVSAATGLYFSKSEYVFFSHNDMIALKKDFLEFLISKLNDEIRIASFTQRHVIPFTGCMLADRKMLKNSETDWLLYDKNHYIEKNDFLKKLCSLKKEKNLKLPCDWIDSGEAFIYEETTKGKKVFAAASFGGTKGLEKTPFDIAGTSKHEIEKIGNAIIFGKLAISKKEFKNRYKFVIKAGKKWENLRWMLSRKKNYWRYSFDDRGELIFIHHGRGTRRSINRWLKFTSNLNKTLR